MAPAYWDIVCGGIDCWVDDSLVGGRLIVAGGIALLVPLVIAVGVLLRLRRRTLAQDAGRSRWRKYRIVGALAVVLVLSIEVAWVVARVGAEGPVRNLDTETAAVFSRIRDTARSAESVYVDNGLDTVTGNFYVNVNVAIESDVTKTIDSTLAALGWQNVCRMTSAEGDALRLVAVKEANVLALSVVPGFKRSQDGGYSVTDSASAEIVGYGYVTKDTLFKRLVPWATVDVAARGECGP